MITKCCHSVFRGLDKYEEKDTGIFVARVVPGGQAARYGVRENDKLLTINGKTPRNVDDAVGVIKQAGNQIKLVVLREEDVGPNPDIIVDEGGERTSLASGEVDSKWVSGSIIAAAWTRNIINCLLCTAKSRFFNRYTCVHSVFFAPFLRVEKIH